jgi:hypothetical protein
MMVSHQCIAVSQWRPYSPCRCCHIVLLATVWHESSPRYSLRSNSSNETPSSTAHMRGALHLATELFPSNLLLVSFAESIDSRYHVKLRTFTQRTSPGRHSCIWPRAATVVDDSGERATYARSASRQRHFAVLKDCQPLIQQHQPLRSPATRQPRLLHHDLIF